MRVVKEAEERRSEILDVAEKLFCTKGYDNTSTNDILNQVGIARGTLYYHFESKEDILDGMIERLTNQILVKARHIAYDETIPVLERMTKTIMSLNVDNELGDMIMEQVHKPQNALLHQKMEEILLENVNEMVTQIVLDGISKGILHTDYPREAVEMIMTYSYRAFDGLMEYSQEEEQRKIMGFIYHTERVFGMEQGSLMETIKPIFDK